MKDFNFVEFKNFVLVGLLNTLIGYSIIIIFIFLKFDNYTSNFLGYFFGMLVSFFLHKNLTFQIQHFRYYEFFKYLFVYFVSYLLNFFILYILLSFLKFNQYLSQLISIFCYSIFLFLNMKLFVFKK